MSVSNPSHSIFPFIAIQLLPSRAKFSLLDLYCVLLPFLSIFFIPLSFSFMFWKVSLILHFSYFFYHYIFITKNFVLSSECPSFCSFIFLCFRCKYFLNQFENTEQKFLHFHSYSLNDRSTFQGTQNYHKYSFNFHLNLVVLFINVICHECNTNNKNIFLVHFFQVYYCLSQLLFKTMCNNLLFKLII